MRDIADKIIVKESCELLKAESFPCLGAETRSKSGLEGGEGWMGNGYMDGWIDLCVKTGWMFICKNH